MTLPTGWEKTNLAELSSKIGSGSTPRGGHVSYKTDGVPLIRSMNVHFGSIKMHGLVFLDKQQAKYLEGVTVRSDDILLNITGASIGRVCRAPIALSGARVNQHVCIIRTTDVMPAFVERYLSSPDMQAYIIQENYGQTRQALTKGMISELTIPIPPLAEQHRIVARLDTLTAHVARARAELDRVRLLATRLREAALSALWCEPADLALPEVLAAPLRNGLSIAGSESPPGQAALKLSALRSWTVDLSVVRYLDRSPASVAAYQIQPGDVLVSRGNGTKSLVGKASLVPLSSTGTYPIFPDTAFRLRLDYRRISAQWLVFVWNSPEVRSQLESGARTSAGIWKISQRDLLSVRLPRISRDEQDVASRDVQDIFARASRLEAEAARASALLDRLEAAILTEAFRGELVLQNPNDEPASVLLNRIRAQRAAAPAPKRGRRAGPVLA